jgi:hypothetical protein
VKYLFLLYDNESAMPKPGSAELQNQLQAYGAFYEDTAKKGAFQSGDPVQPSQNATTVRVRGGNTQQSSGPFNSAGDQIIGFYVLDCKDGDEATAYAAKIPAASTGAVEVRPILSM